MEEKKTTSFDSAEQGRVCEPYTYVKSINVKQSNHLTRNSAAIIPVLTTL